MYGSYGEVEEDTLDVGIRAVVVDWHGHGVYGCANGVMRCDVMQGIAYSIHREAGGWRGRIFMGGIIGVGFVANWQSLCFWIAARRGQKERGKYGKEIGKRAIRGREKSKTDTSTGVGIGAVCKSNDKQCRCRATEVATEHKQ